MNINFTRRDLWGNRQKREMELIFQSNKMVIARYVIEHAQKPLIIDDTYVLENRYTAVSFIEFGKWYILNKIFNFDAHPTGYLIDVTTPIEENLTYLATTDLFVKIWVTLSNEYRFFGTSAFKDIAENGLITNTVKTHAKETLNDLVSQIRQKTIPQPIARQFTLEKQY
jgi:predicted RNA-binding protein associated with RNAse of E/G family